MFAFADVMHLFTHKFASLGTRRFSLTFVPACSFDCFLFWHIVPFIFGRTGFLVRQRSVTIIRSRRMSEVGETLRDGHAGW
jgi:hypothetical protein